MDARLTIENVLGLSTGDAHIIRNAGGIATDDAIRSLLISHELLGTEEFLVINHILCVSALQAGHLAYCVMTVSCSIDFGMPCSPLRNA
jgi:carbonic anhydrase